MASTGGYVRVTSPHRQGSTLQRSRSHRSRDLPRLRLTQPNDTCSISISRSPTTVRRRPPATPPRRVPRVRRSRDRAARRPGLAPGRRGQSRSSRNRHGTQCDRASRLGRVLCARSPCRPRVGHPTDRDAALTRPRASTAPRPGSSHSSSSSPRRSSSSAEPSIRTIAPAIIPPSRGRLETTLSIPPDATIRRLRHGRRRPGRRSGGSPGRLRRCRRLRRFHAPARRKPKPWPSGVA